MNILSSVKILFLCIGISLMNLQEVHAQTNVLEKLLNTNRSLFEKVMSNPAKYQLQVRYTQIDRDAHNKPRFTTYDYRVDRREYFYPASSIKLCGAVLALEKLNDLKIKGLDKHTPLRIDSAYRQQMAADKDETSADGVPTIAHYIKKLLLVSDNDAYNRMYEFLGQQRLNEALHKKGFKDVRLLHRLSVGDGEERTRYTNPFTFYRGDTVVYRQPLVYNPKYYTNELKTVFRGKAYFQNDKLINSPMNFSTKNAISVDNLHGILKTIMFPEAMPARQRFNLTDDDYEFLYRYMSMFPRESRSPVYDSKEYYDSYVKFFIFGDREEKLSENIRIFNKVGWAYGYMIDNAYIADFENKVEFLLTAVIYVNEDEVLNDDKYEYKEIGTPFMANLGRVIYEYELKRPKKYLPDLSRFRVSY